MFVAWKEVAEWDEKLRCGAVGFSNINLILTLYSRCSKLVYISLFIKGLPLQKNQQMLKRLWILFTKSILSNYSLYYSIIVTLLSVNLPAPLTFNPNNSCLHLVHTHMINLSTFTSRLANSHTRFYFLTRNYQFCEPTESPKWVFRSPAQI